MLKYFFFQEEASYSNQLSSIEKIQELELTVSDQQTALQKLTLENKALREKSRLADHKVDFHELKYVHTK